jgi:hypothetical protein
MLLSARLIEPKAWHWRCCAVVALSIDRAEGIGAVALLLCYQSIEPEAWHRHCCAVVALAYQSIELLASALVRCCCTIDLLVLRRSIISIEPKAWWHLGTKPDATLMTVTGINAETTTTHSQLVATTRSYY